MQARQTECGLSAAAAACYSRRVAGETAVTRIMAGIVFDHAAAMALRAPIDPLELALEVFNALQTGPARLLIGYHLALERRNTMIVEQGRRAHEEDRARHTAERGRARGTRSTRAHGKKKAGRR